MSCPSAAVNAARERSRNRAAERPSRTPRLRAQATPSRRHSNVDPLFDEVNANVALVTVVETEGCEVIEV